VDACAEYRNLEALGGCAGDDEQARMLLTLIRGQNLRPVCLLRRAFSLVRKEKARKSNRRRNVGLGRDASSRAMCCSKCLSDRNLFFGGSPTGLCAPGFLYPLQRELGAGIEHSGIRIV